MSRSICKGPLFLFVPLLLGCILAYCSARMLRPVFGVLAWYWFVALFVLCFTLSLLIVGGLGYVLERLRPRHQYDDGQQESDEGTKQSK